MRAVHFLIGLLAAATASSCAVTTHEAEFAGDQAVTAEMLLDASPLLGGSAPADLSGVDILEMTPEMKTFVDSYVQGARNRYARMKRLVFAVMEDGQFELVYDDQTRTAAETFRAQRGNCLSFTNLFVAMARYLSIKATYQEVDIPPDWSLAGDSFLFSQHVNVELDLGADVIRVVDFNTYDFDSELERRLISDQRARAHYFSNIGVDHLLDADTQGAFAHFRQALREDRSFAPAWINIGILYRRDSYPRYAEAAFLAALDLDPSNLVAMSNLANLYQEEGLSERAAYYADRVESHRMGNPYYRYHLAQQAVMEGDYEAAVRHLKFAIRKRDNEDRFYALLGVSYLLVGEEAAARRWMQKAEEVAAKETDKLRYHNKVDRLISHGVRPDGVR